MKNWYCKPASKAETIEIVERAVANGAVAQDCVKGMDFGTRPFFWNVFRYFGVINSRTCGFDFCIWEAELLTIQQVREQFPFPNEVKVMSDKKEWQGMQDGLPPAEIDIEVKKDGRWIGATTVGKFGEWMVCAPVGGGFYGFGIGEFRPIRTEREKWVSDAQKHCTEFSSNQLGKLYDAIKSGALKAPEAE